MTIALPVEQTRAEGLLGASEAAAALGLDKYTSPLTIWRRKRGLETDGELPEAVREAAEWGQALEPIVRGKYALLVDRSVFVPRSSITHVDGWLRATPDGFVRRDPALGAIVVTEWDPPARGEMTAVGSYGVPAMTEGLLQCKTASAWLRDEWEGGIPAKYEVQVRVEMAVTNLPWCDVCCLLGGQRFVGPIRIERDAAIEEAIIRDLRVFWECVQSGREPPIDGSSAWRRHVSESMRPTKVTMQADEDMDDLAAFLMARRATRKKAQEEEEAAKTDILLRLSAAGATALQLSNGKKITAYRTGARSDWKSYAMSLGGESKIPDEFKGSAGSWTLRMPGEDDE